MLCRRRGNLLSIQVIKGNAANNYYKRTIWLLQVWDNKILWKEYLNSDGQQIHQYQQNKLSPLTSSHWIQKDYDTCVGNPDHGLGQAQTCAEVSRLMWSLLIIGSPTTILIQQKILHRFTSTQKDYTLSQKWTTQTWTNI